MNRASVVLTRIDNRLVHGQVGMTWTNSLNVDTIVVVDDDVASNPMRQKLMESVAKSANVQIRFYSIAHFSQIFFTTDSHQKLFLVVNDPTVVKKLVECALPIHSVNVGNMHYQRGKVAFNRKVYVSEEDIEALNYLMDKDVHLYYQDVPGTTIEKMETLVYETLKKKRY